jgi:hypothetical protein
MASAEWGYPVERQMQARVVSPAVDGAREGVICAANAAIAVLAVEARRKAVSATDGGAMAGQWQGARQGSGQADGSFSVDEGDGARMCTASQRICSDTDGRIWEQAAIRSREYLPVDLLTDGVSELGLAGVVSSGRLPLSLSSAAPQSQSHLERLRRRGSWCRCYRAALMWRRRDGTTVGQEGHGRDHIVHFSFGTVRVIHIWNKSLGGNARK